MNARRYHQWTNHEIARAANRVRDQVPVEQIAADLGVSGDSMRSALQSRGLSVKALRREGRVPRETTPIQVGILMYRMLTRPHGAYAADLMGLLELQPRTLRRRLESLRDLGLDVNDEGRGRMRRLWIGG